MIIPFFKKIIAKEGFHMAVPSKKVLTKALDWADIVMIETPFPLSFHAAKIAKKMGKPVTGTFHIFPDKEQVGDPFTIICIGRFSKEKHQETLFKVLELSKHSKKFKVFFQEKDHLKRSMKNSPIILKINPF